MKVVDIVWLVATHGLVPGEKKVILGRGGFGLGLLKNTIYQLTRTFVTLPITENTGISLPTLLGSNGTSLSSEVINVIVSYSESTNCNSYILVEMFYTVERGSV